MSQIRYMKVGGRRYSIWAFTSIDTLNRDLELYYGNDIKRVNKLEIPEDMAMKAEYFYNIDPSRSELPLAINIGCIKKRNHNIESLL